jgi:hypothetical protein
MTTHVTSIVAYDGDALRTGEMDVRDLAPALLGIGDMARDANRLLNGTRAEVSVKVHADFRAGSFAVTITLFQTLQPIIDLFDGATLVDAIALAKMLGLVAVAEKPKEIIESVFALAKFLGGGEAKSKEPTGDGRMTITNQRGDTTIVNSGTVILIEDNSVRADMRRVLGPLAVDGVETFETRNDGGYIDIIHKADVAMIAPPRQPATVASEALRPDIETRAIGLFQIVSVNFKEGNKWKLNSGQGDFWAEITDEGFLAKVHRRDILFGEGDVLRAEYVSRATRKAAGKIDSEWTIERVIDVIPPEPQGVQPKIF